MHASSTAMPNTCSRSCGKKESSAIGTAYLSHEHDHVQGTHRHPGFTDARRSPSTPHHHMHLHDQPSRSPAPARSTIHSIDVADAHVDAFADDARAPLPRHVAPAPL